VPCLRRWGVGKKRGAKGEPKKAGQTRPYTREAAEGSLASAGMTDACYESRVTSRARQGVAERTGVRYSGR